MLQKSDENRKNVLDFLSTNRISTNNVFIISVFIEPKKKFYGNAAQKSLDTKQFWLVGNDTGLYILPLSMTGNILESSVIALTEKKSTKVTINNSTTGLRYNIIIESENYSNTFKANKKILLYKYQSEELNKLIQLYGIIQP